MSNRFIDKLALYATLSDDDRRVLAAISSQTRRYPARHDLIREGDEPGPVFVMLDGWACRYKILPGGGRQILAFLMPGDTCDMHVSVLAEMDHSIQTLTPARVAAITRTDMYDLVMTRPQVAHAFWSTQLVDEGILRAWIASMGRRDSLARVAHLMCELYLRARNVGLVHGREMELPLTQIVLADSLGLTPVHINRVFRKLREAQTMEVREGSLVILDAAKLAKIAGFDDNYLHRRLRRTA